MKVLSALAGLGTAAALLVSPLVALDSDGTAGAVVITASIWDEASQGGGDAGSAVGAAQNLIGGAFVGINGSLGEKLHIEGFDTTDAYRFFFGGGNFLASGGFTVALNSTDTFGLSLYSGTGNSTALLGSANSFLPSTTVLNVTGLTAGLYTLLVNTTLTVDPPYLVVLDSPVFGVDQISEPAAIAIFGIGLAGLAVAARRRRQRMGVSAER
jgi:PEP-CTERM motif